METGNHAVTSKDGYLIDCRVWKPSATPLSACIYIHGGAFVNGDADSAPGISSFLASTCHCVVITCSFRNGPSAPYASGKSMMDLIAVSRYLMRLPICSDLPFGIVGSSSGGYFSLSLAKELDSTSSFPYLVHYCIAICPVAHPGRRSRYLQSCMAGTAAADGYMYYHPPARAALIHQTQLSFWEQEKFADDAGEELVRHFPVSNIPTLCILGAEDMNVPPQVTMYVQQFATKTISIGRHGHEICSVPPTIDSMSYVDDVKRFIELSIELGRQRVVGVAEGKVEDHLAPVLAPTAASTTSTMEKPVIQDAASSCSVVPTMFDSMFTSTALLHILPAQCRLRVATLADVASLRQLEQGVVEAERPFDKTIHPTDAQYYDIEHLILEEQSCLLLVEEISITEGDEGGKGGKGGKRDEGGEGGKGGEEGSTTTCSNKTQLLASGYVQVRRSKKYKTHSNHGYLGFMFVHQSVRGKGVNQVVTSALVEWAEQQHHVTHFYLDVYSLNNSAVRAYEKAGFTSLLTKMTLCTEGIHTLFINTEEVDNGTGTCTTKKTKENRFCTCSGKM